MDLGRRYQRAEKIAMIRRLKSGKYRLYSRKKNPKTGKPRNLGTFDRKLRRRNTKKRSSISNGNRIWTAIPCDDLDTKVKLAIYEMTAETGRVPNSSEISRRIEIEENEVLTVFGRLHAKRLLLPEPGNLRRIRMAPPFSGVPTAFPVEANGKQYTRSMCFHYDAWLNRCAAAAGITP